MSDGPESNPPHPKDAAATAPKDGARGASRGAPRDGPRGGPRGRKPKTDQRTRAKAARLEKEAGLPRTLAYQVAMGNVSLSEVLERMARRDQVESLMRRHELPKSLATQVALGQADLDQVLIRRRREAHVAEHRERSVLSHALESGSPVLIGLLGARRLEGTITAVDRYEFTLTPKKGEAETVHKVRMKYGVDLSQGMKARGVVKAPKSSVVAEPVWKPQERYGVSDKRLYGYLEDEMDVVATTTEQDVVRGRLSWLGRWEFGMTTRKGIEVVLFRHALCDIRST